VGCCATEFNVWKRKTNIHLIGHHHEAAEKDAYILNADTFVIMQKIEIWKLETESRDYCGNWRRQSDVRMKSRV
jgi:hypothetical protein